MRLLLFGATGSAGGSVLRVALEADAVTQVRAVARRPLGLEHPKLRVFLQQDYLDYGPSREAFAGIDACLFCLGISATQVSAEEYRRITHDFALAAAECLRRESPAAVFHFISGQGTGLDSRFLWARVKAETERDLGRRYDVVCWRPAAIDGVPSASEPRLFKITRPLFRLLRPFRGLYVRGEDIGRAMLLAVAEGVRGRTFENSEIRDLADRSRTEHYSK